MQLFYEKRQSKKGDYFDVIYADLGYRIVYLIFDRSLIAELLGLSVGDLFAVEPGYKVAIGKIDGSVFKVK